MLTAPFGARPQDDETLDETMSTQKPTGSRFEFVVMASARARQLLEGCEPRVEGPQKTARIALREVKTGALWTEEKDTSSDE
jgi:DNA-directed RNA polymerase omega subunit